MSGTLIFISYARRDGKTLANRLRDDLIAAGYDAWLDTSEIEGGASWSAEIESAIENCQITLALLSEASFRSEICRAEQLRSLRKGKRVIPLLVQMNAERPLYLEHLNYRDFSNTAEYAIRLTELLEDITSGTSAALPTRYRHTVVTNAPARPPNFLPRPEVLDMLRRMVTNDSSDRRIAITALQGMGGIGKSVMAAVLCHDPLIQDAYPDGVVWLTIGREPGSMALKLRRLLEALGAAVESNADEEKMIDQLRTLLPSKAALIVLDDVWDAEHLKPFIVENTPGARLLFTTRDSALATATDAALYGLDALNDVEALRLLAQWVNILPDALPETAQQVAAECGNLPLALALCGAQVRDGERWDDLLAALLAADLEFLDHPHGSVMKSIKVSLDALERESNLYARHYRELGVFPEDESIPEAAVMTLWLHTNGINERNARRLITTLSNRALIRTSGESPNRQVGLHDLQHRYLRSALGDLKNAHGKLLDAYRAQCSDGWHTGPNDGYFFEHLTYHLHEAGHKEELYILLINSPNWMEAQNKACKSNANFAADLTLALRDFTDPLTSNNIPTIIRLNTGFLLVSFHADAYFDIALETLVWLGEETKALDLARNRSEPRNRIRGLITIFHTLKEKTIVNPLILEEAQRLIIELPSELRSSSLSNLAAAWSTIKAFDRAEALLPQITGNCDRVYALAFIASQFAHSNNHEKAITFFSQAQKHIRQIHDPSQYDMAINDLLLQLMRAGFEAEALVVTDELRRNAFRQQFFDQEIALFRLAITLATGGNFSMAREIIGEIRQAQSLRIRPLCILARSLAENGFFSEAKKIISEVQADIQNDNQVNFEDVLYLIRAMLEAKLFDLAITTARTLPSSGQLQRVAALYRIAGYFAKNRRYEDAQLFFSEATLGTNLLLERIDELNLISILSALMPILNLKQRQEALRKIQALVGMQTDTLSKEKRMLELVRVYIRLEKLEDAQQVIGLIPKNIRAEAQYEIAKAYAKFRRTEDAEQLIMSIEEGFWKSKAWSVLVDSLTRQGQPKRAAALIEHLQTKASEEWSTQFSLGLALFSIGIIDEACEAVRKAQLAIIRSTEQTQDQANHNFRRGLLTQEELYMIWLDKKSQKDRAYIQLLDALTETKLAAFLVHDLTEIARNHDSLSVRQHALKTLAITYANEGSFDRAEQVAQSIDFGGLRKEVSAVLASYLASQNKLLPALKLLRTQELAHYVEMLIQWTVYWEKLKPGLTLEILTDVVHILEWICPDWREIHALLAAKEQGTDA